MKIHPIDPDDLPAVVQLLCEGFPSRDAGYWQHALALLADRPKIGDLPQFGLALAVEDRIEGVMLMISADIAGTRYCNLSSWYVRPDFRRFSPFLFQKSLKVKDVTYTDCSPAPHVLPIVEKFGFAAYTGGTLLVDVRAALRGGAPVHVLDSGNLSRVDPARQATIRAHLSWGCQGLLLEGQDDYPVALLYRTARLKRLVPAARFILGNPEVLVANAGPIMRRLMARGIVVALIDAPAGGAFDVGRLMPDYGRRYCKGAHPPPVGDLRETELALFGL